MANLKVAEIKIGIDVLNALAPKRGMLNAKESDLKDQVFVLHSMVTNDPDKSTDLKAVGEDNTFVKAKYVNKENSKAFLVPIRSLLNMDVATIDSDNTEFTAETPTMRVHEWLINSIEDKKDVNLPGEFKVVNVENRKQEGTDNVMYPPYCYAAYNERVKELRADPEWDGTLDSIYNDFEFMTGLYAGELEKRFETAEPNKNITIKI
jgi:hypothetical protein